MSRLSFCFSWYASALTSLIFSSLFLIYLIIPQKITQRSTQYRLYQALPSNKILITENIYGGDGRSLIIENFFKYYNSVLAQFSDKFVKISDFYQLDYRLLPAIAMQESNGGKKAPQGTYNPFGYGIYGSKKVHFSSWEDAIEIVGKAIREDYLNQGLKTPETIMKKYTPPSLAKGGAWAKGVSHFMEELR